MTNYAELMDRVKASQTEDGIFPSLKDAHALALFAAELFYDAASVEETNWTGWGEQTVPFKAEWRRVKAKQGFDAIRDADLLTALEAQQ